MQDEGGALARLAEPLWKRHRGSQRVLHFLRQCAQHRRAKNSGRYCQHANAELREFARCRERQRSNSALGRRIGGLSDLSLERGNGGGGNDYATLAAWQWFSGL